MASKKIYHDLDLVAVSQLLNARLHNVDNAGMATLGGSLGVSNVGLTVWNTDTEMVHVWDGVQFVALAVTVEGDVVFRDVVDASTSLDAQAEAIAGYQYIVGTAGTLAMTGVTFLPDAVVQVGDMVLFTSATTAYVLQRNDVDATETVVGNVRLATQAEADAGANDTAAITSLKLQTKLETQAYTRQYTVTTDLVANTPATITHNLDLADRDAYTINVTHGNEVIGVAVVSIGANSLSVESSVALTGARITVVGAAAV